jgi:hypothetical protein
MNKTRRRSLLMLVAILLVETGWGSGCEAVTRALGM